MFTYTIARRHHRALREAQIEATEALLAQRGAEGLQATSVRAETTMQRFVLPPETLRQLQANAAPQQTFSAVMVP